MLYMVLFIFVILAAIVTYFLTRTLSTIEEPLIPFTKDDVELIGEDEKAQEPKSKKIDDRNYRERPDIFHNYRERFDFFHQEVVYVTPREEILDLSQEELEKMLQDNLEIKKDIVNLYDSGLRF